ncbi:ESPR-type extended signal peptide-containing protein [uncultured Dialister sp.]|uniref:ESPR-type extended signal peptide-containing protein n=1 Tax=uncultured Dialister sp. TaxID=278064 RepID=UPI0025FE50CA|nr:ESPR-type extended signal peptide-containing protein [uncultured Dialister sp.]
MNKIFKVIFSKAKGCYVVVSELAKSTGGGTPNFKIKRGYSLTLAAAVMSMLLGLAPVGAVDTTSVDLGNSGSAAYDDKGNLTIGDKETVAEGANKNGSNNTTIGTKTDTLRNVTKGETTKNGQPMDEANTKLVDGEGAAHKLDTSTESGGSTAVGYNNRAEGDNSTAIGNTAKITNKPITYYADKDGNKTTSTDDAAWYKDSSGNPTEVPQVFRDADGNTTTTPQYVHTYTVTDPNTGVETTKTEITSDDTKADQKDGKPVYNYQKSDNLDKLYSVTLYQAASNSIAAGSNVTANGSNAVAVGYQSTADNSAVAVGDTAVAKENGVAIGKNTKASVEGSIALGKGSQADRSGGTTGWDPKTGTTSTQSGLAWKSTEGALSVGNGSASRQITGVAAGSEDTDAVNLAQLKNAMTHYYSVKTTETTDKAGNNNYLNDGATGNNALAAGVSAVAKGNNATAVGTQTYASGEDASAYGYRAAAMGKDSVSIGSGTSAQQEGSVAIGGHAIGSNSIAIGSDYRSNRVSAAGSSSIAIGGYTNSDYNVAIGSGASTSGPYAITVGGSATSDHAVSIGGVAGNSQATAVGSGSSATGQQSTAIGAYSAVSGSHAVTVGGTASGDNAVSVGGVASDNATAVGRGSTASSGQSTAVGFQSAAGGSNSTAIGLSAAASGSSATAAGYGTNAQGNYSTALGNMSSARGENSTAVGGASARGKNVTAIGKSSTVEGNGYYDDSVTDATAIGGAHVGGNASYSTAIGSNATTDQNYGVALGYNSNVSYASTGVGSGTKASNTGTAVGYNAQSSGYQSAAVGAGSNATGQNAVALGGGGAWGNYSIALGSGAGTKAHGIAIGQNSGVWGESAIAIGEGTNAWRANSIVLGKNSKSGADKNIEGYDPHTGVASVDDTSTWQSTDEAVSIGRAEERDGDGKITATAITRQLNNLAAGTLDTDAVNVAQLKAATQKVNVHDYSVWSPDTETDTNYTNEGAVAKNSMAAGVSASTTKNAENAVAIGYKAKAEGVGATVIGQYGTATGQYATAFGGINTDSTGTPVNNTASGANSLAFGERTAASGNNSTAFGWQTKATEKRATAFGERTTASGANSTAFGQLAVASGQNSTAFGNEAVANNYGSTAFGNRTEALGEYSTAFGNSTVAAGMNTVAFGTDNVAGAVLDDNGAYTNIIYQTNPKNGRVVKDKDGNPIEISRQKMDARGNLAYLDGGNTKSVTYTVSGGETHSYVLLQGEDGNTYIRDYRGNIRSATIADDGTVTVGDKPLTNVTLKKANAGANGYHILSNANATVWGENSIASGEASTAFGIGSNAAAKNSLAALGGTVDETAANAAAIGSGAQAKLADSVALGSGALANRSSGSKGYDVLTGKASSNTSAAWISKANAIAVGNGSTLTRQITGVAAGSQDTDAVNVAQLKAAGFKVTTQHNSNISSSILNGDTLDFEGTDNAIVSTTKDSKTITVAVSKTPTFDSATFYNPNPTAGQNNEKVTIANGHISTYNKDQQERAVLGTDNQGNGTIHLVNNDLSQVHLYTQKANDDNGVNDGVTRMWYTASSDGEGTGIHTIAVLDDGINYVGDNYTDDKKTNKVVVKHKLNSTMDVTGGADTTNLSDGNIGVVATPAVEDDQGNITQKAKLEIKLNKDLQNLNSVTAGNVRIGNNPANTLKLTENGQETENTAPAGNYATGLDNKAWDTKNPSYVSGRAATEDQLAKVSGVVDKGLSFTANTKDATNTTDNYAGYKVVNRQLGDTISIKAGDADPNMKYETKNLTSQIAENGDITISMAESPTFNIVTATSLDLSPKDITTKDQNGYTASAQLDAHYRNGSLNPKKNVTMADGSTGMVRLHYHDGEGTVHDLATMDDGQIYAGDIKTDGSLDTIGFGRRMNQKTTINGGVTNKDNLTDNNIGVVSNGTDTLTAKLAKNLQNLESVQAGKTTIDDNGLTIRKSDDDSSKNVVVLGDKVAFGDNQVNNMGSGASKITEDDKGNKTYEYNTLNNGANIGDVKNIANSIVQPVIDTVNKGWELDVNGMTQKAVTPTSPKVNLIQGQNITITGDTTNTENVTIATADDVRFNMVRVGGVKTDASYTGGIVIGQQSGGDSANPDKNDYITGLKNINWDSNKIQSGRAATEDQLKKVADDIKQGTVAGDVYVTGGEVSYHTDGGTDNGQPTVNDGTGKLILKENNKTSKVEITGLHDYYVTNGTVTDDGKTLELTRNDRDEKGNPQKISVDLSNVLKSDQHLVANPADGTNGKYTVDATSGTVTLKVKNGDTYDDITIGGFEGLGKGMKFGANKMAKDGGNPVTNQLGSTINITGAGTKELDKYSGKNLLTSVEQDADGNTIVHVLMDKNISADGVTVGQAGKDGVAGADGEVGKAGTIGINGKNGVKGEHGKQGITTTIIRTEKGQAGEDGEIGQQGAPGVDGTDITRIVYQNDQDKVDGKNGSHTVATLDDGLKFSGDDNKVITKKLNEQLQFVGGADKNKLTQNNIGINELEDGKLTIQLVNTPDLREKGSLKAGNAQIGWFAGETLNMTKDGINPSGNQAGEGSYATGLSNTDWNLETPEYVSGRAATEDQLAKVSKAINNAATAAGKRTVVTVNDKANPAEATPKDGDYGDYDSTNGNLMIAAKKDSYGQMTYNIKLNDKLALGKDGTDGQEGTLGLTGKDGLPGADGKQGYSTTIIKTEKEQAGKDGKTGKENLGGTDITRIVYTDKDGSNPQTVATLDDGLKFVGNDGQEVTRKLNETLSIKGGLDKDAVAKASNKNLGVRQNEAKDGLEIVMTDTPDFTKVTVGGDKKITIGEQTVTGKKSDGTDGTAETGNYITGLDNTKWNKDNVVANRAATEGQLSQAINDIKGSTNGGFGLADEKGGTVKKDLGDIITVKGDGKNIETKVDGGALEVSLKKDVDLGNNGSIKAGNTTINSDGVDTNKVKVGDITITKDDGINGGGKQITNIASGIDGKQYKDAGDNNGASIGDVKQLAKNEAKASEAKSGKNITVKDDHTVNLNDDITLGNDSNKQVAINGSNGQVTIGSGDKAMTLGKQANTAGDSNPKEGNFLNGLDNRKWDGEHIQSGRAATEDQLKTVSDKVNSGRKFQGDDGKDVTVDLGKPLNIKGGATEVSEANNIGIVKGDDNTLNVRLAKDLTGLNSVTTGNTTINNNGLTVKGDDNHDAITIQQGNINMGGNKIEGVAPGKIAPDSTDAVNGSQLYATNQNISNLGGEVNKLGTRVNRVGANAAALAALHPLDFDPDDKWDFAAGYGNYKNANAAAIGAYYRPNEDTMFSVGGSFGGGENMVNAGISVKLGQGNHVSTSRVAMAKEIKDLRKDVADLKAVVNQQSALIDKLTGVNAGQLSGSDDLFPDVPANHWAYEYVTKLRQAGILTGYPDGNFAGDRMMTRYEFAAIVYRAIMAGAAANPNLNRDGTLDRLAKEFSGEMKYIRIDTIRKDRNGKPTIQRVRVIKEEEK